MTANGSSDFDGLMAAGAATPSTGHPRFYELTRHEEDLHTRKNADYAGGGEPMGNFNRVSDILSLYPGFPVDENYGVAIVYMLKQLDAAMWLIATGREGEVEGVPERLGDIGVYAKLARIMYEERGDRLTFGLTDYELASEDLGSGGYPYWKKREREVDETDISGPQYAYNVQTFPEDKAAQAHAEGNETSRGKKVRVHPAAVTEVSFPADFIGRVLPVGATHEHDFVGFVEVGPFMCLSEHVHEVVSSDPGIVGGDLILVEWSTLPQTAKVSYLPGQATPKPVETGDRVRYVDVIASLPRLLGATGTVLRSGTTYDVQWDHEDKPSFDHRGHCLRAIAPKDAR